MSLPLQLVIRLLSLFVGNEGVTVYESRLPDALSDLPLPEGTRVAVSYIRWANETDFLAGVALDTSLTPEAFMTEMARELEQNGWNRIHIQPPSVEPLLFDSFSPPPLPLEMPVYTPFFTKGELALWVEYPSSGPGRPTRTSLRIERADALPPPESAPGRLPNLLPLLAAPEGSEFGVGLTSVGDDDVNGKTTIITELSSAQLAEHFASQLEASGWRVTERLLGEQAALVVLERKVGRRTYDAQLSVFRLADLYSTVKVEASRRSNR